MPAKLDKHIYFKYTFCKSPYQYKLVLQAVWKFKVGANVCTA